MAECRWVLLCDYAFLDRAGKPCLIGVFDGIYAKGVPTLHHQAALVAQLEGEPNEQATVRIELVRPTGAVLAKVEGDTQLNGHGKGGLQFQLANLQLPDYGRYQCNVYLDGALAASTAFKVDPVASSKPS